MCVCVCVCVCVCLTSTNLSADVLTLTVVTLTVFAMNPTVSRWMAGTLSTLALTYEHRQIFSHLSSVPQLSCVWNRWSVEYCTFLIFCSKFKSRESLPQCVQWLILNSTQSAWQHSLQLHGENLLCKSLPVIDTHVDYTPTHTHTSICCSPTSISELPCEEGHRGTNWVSMPANDEAH